MNEETPQVDLEDGSQLARDEAEQRGWAVTTVDGDRVMVVEKTATPAGDILTAEDGTKYAVTTMGVLALDEDGRIAAEPAAEAEEEEAEEEEAEEETAEEAEES